MTTRRRGHPGFDALVDCIVQELEGLGITLTPELVHDELRAMLRSPESAGGLPEAERLDLLGPRACTRLAARLRARLQLPDLAVTSGPGDLDTRPDAAVDRSPCAVVDLDERRRRAR